ncbi:hypothetical protein MBLNU457_g0429t2 [Dothideomycetes sp. NU457]
MSQVDVSKGMPLTRSSSLVLVLDTPKGRGIFASTAIPGGTIIETCPVLVLDRQENIDHIEKTDNWPSEDASGKPITTQAVVLGLGSMFNHSTADQNVGWQRDVDKLLVTYRTLRDIAVGEELCISYGSRLTFVDADAPAPMDEGDGSDLLGSIQLG